MIFIFSLLLVLLLMLYDIIQLNIHIPYFNVSIPTPFFTLFVCTLISYFYYSPDDDNSDSYNDGDDDDKNSDSDDDSEEEEEESDASGSEESDQESGTEDDSEEEEDDKDDEKEKEKNSMSPEDVETLQTVTNSLDQLMSTAASFHNIALLLNNKVNYLESELERVSEELNQESKYICQLLIKYVLNCPRETNTLSTSQTESKTKTKESSKKSYSFIEEHSNPFDDIDVEDDESKEESSLNNSTSTASSLPDVKYYVLDIKLYNYAKLLRMNKSILHELEVAINGGIYNFLFKRYSLSQRTDIKVVRILDRIIVSLPFSPYHNSSISSYESDEVVYQALVSALSSSINVSISQFISETRQTQSASLDIGAFHPDHCLVVTLDCQMFSDDEDYIQFVDRWYCNQRDRYLVENLKNYVRRPKEFTKDTLMDIYYFNNPIQSPYHTFRNELDEYVSSIQKVVTIFSDKSSHTNKNKHIPFSLQSDKWTTEFNYFYHYYFHSFPEQ